MFTIERTNEAGEKYTTTSKTIELAQRDARQWMNYWKTTVVFYTSCPQLKLFAASQFAITKETK